MSPSAAGVDARTTLAVAVTVVSGSLVAVQQRVNGELGVRLDDVLAASLVSFVTGLAAVAAFVLSRRRSRAALARVREVPWWSRLGGLGGASLVAVGATAAPRIGVSLLTVGLVAGQTTGGLVVDRTGLSPGGTHLLSWPRVAGAALALLAVGLGALDRGTGRADPALLLLVVAAGSLVALQQAFNGRVRMATGDAGVATMVNFLVGTAALALGFGLALAVRGLPGGSWPGADSWYLYLGGPVGVTFVAVAALVVRRLGVLRTGLAVVTGQLVGALVLDVVLPATGEGIPVTTLLGAALTAVAVVLTGRGARRP